MTESLEPLLRPRSRLGRWQPARGVAIVANAERRFVVRALGRARPRLLLSALVHLILLGLLLFTWPQQPGPIEAEPGPAVSVVLGPPSENQTTPAPTPEAAAGRPEAEIVERTQTPGPLQTPLPTETPEAAPAVLPTVPPPILSSISPAPPLPPPSPAPQAASASAPGAPSVPTVVPPPTAAPPEPDDFAVRSAPALPNLPLPPPVPPEAPPVREALVQPPPLPARPSIPVPAPPVIERPHATPQPRRPPTAFPVPTFSSLGGAFSFGAPSPRSAGKELPGPVKPGNSTAFRSQYTLSGDQLGDGWERLFGEWVEQHKYYPQQAAANGEDGTAAVRIVVERDGRVRSVTLLERSGSQWLDLGLTALFRGRRVPAIPANFSGDEATVNLVMHYILLH